MRNSVSFLLVITILTALTACTKSHVRQLVGVAIADSADTQVKYSAFECRTLEQRCVQGEYQEWETSDKALGCSCKKL